MKLVRWQRHARDVARALGAAAGDGGTAGCRLPGWAILAMTRASAPDWLFAALDRAARRAGAGERAAVVVSVVSQGVRLRRVVLLSFEDFQSLTGGSEAGERAVQK